MENLAINEIILQGKIYRISSISNKNGVNYKVLMCVTFKDVDYIYPIIFTSDISNKIKCSDIVRVTGKLQNTEEGIFILALDYKQISKYAESLYENIVNLVGVIKDAVKSTQGINHQTVCNVLCKDSVLMSTVCWNKTAQTLQKNIGSMYEIQGFLLGRVTLDEYDSFTSTKTKTKSAKFIKNKSDNYIKEKFNQMQVGIQQAIPLDISKEK